MTAAQAARFAPRMGEHVEPLTLAPTMADNVVIYEGTMVGIDAAGNVRPMTVSATTAKCLGVAEATVDNTETGHVIAGKKCPIRQGTFRFANAGDLTKVHVGGPCYAVDDSTVSLSTGGGARAICGTVELVDTAGVWVKINADYRGIDDAALRVDIASTANGAGASLVGIEDAAALLAALTVEAAILELAKYEAINLADPGGANAAIGVTRSATVDFTIGSAGAETNTLAIPSFEGQRLLLNANTVGTGTRAVTSAQAINQTGNTVMTFAQARDAIGLAAIKVGGALRWTVVFNDGVVLS